MSTLYEDLENVVKDHCEGIACVNGALLEKSLRALLEQHKSEDICTQCDMPMPEGCFGIYKSEKKCKLNEVKP